MSHYKLRYSLDGGETFEDVPDGMRVVVQDVDLPEEGVPGELQLVLSREGLICDVWASREASLDCNLGTASETYDELTGRLMGRWEAPEDCTTHEHEDGGESIVDYLWRIHNLPDTLILVVQHAAALRMTQEEGGLLLSWTDDDDDETLGRELLIGPDTPHAWTRNRTLLELDGTTSLILLKDHKWP